MKFPTFIFFLSVAMNASAQAQSLIDAHCGLDHKNELAANQVISENPDGFYLPGLKTQLSHGDPRIIRAVGSEFHLCTRDAARPNMDATQLYTLTLKREVKYLFVPNKDCPTGPNS